MLLPVIVTSALAIPHSSIDLNSSSVHAEHLHAFGDKAPSLSVQLTPTPAASTPDVTVYGYHAYWTGSPLDLDFSRLTHVAVFNVDLNADGSLSDTHRWTDVAEALVPLAHSHDVAVHLCMTSFTDDVTNAVLSDSDKRALTIAELKSLVEDYGADGVNVDIEGLDSSQKENMVAFIEELSQQVDEVFIATPPIDWSNAFDYDALAQASDGLFIMGYGYHWSGGDPGPVAPLFGGSPWGSNSLQASVLDYLSHGAHADKIILGLPLYGRQWPTDGPDIPGTATGSGTAVFMAEAVQEANAEGSDWDDVTHTPYILHTTSQLWYDDTDSIQDKVSWAISEGLQGVGFWALQYEGDDPEFWEMISEETTLPSTRDDNKDTSDTQTEEGNKPPVAVAGAAMMAYPSNTVILNGSGSYDPEGEPISFVWAQTSGPAVMLADWDTSAPSFTVTQPGVHTISLVVDDGVQISVADSVDVVVVDPDAATRHRSGGCVTSPLAGGLTFVVLGIGIRRRRHR